MWKRMCVCVPRCSWCSACRIAIYILYAYEPLWHKYMPFHFIFILVNTYLRHFERRDVESARRCLIRSHNQYMLMWIPTVSPSCHDGCAPPLHRQLLMQHLYFDLRLLNFSVGAIVEGNKQNVKEKNAKNESNTNEKQMDNKVWSWAMWTWNGGDMYYDNGLIINHFRLFGMGSGRS